MFIASLILLVIAFAFFLLAFFTVKSHLKKEIVEHNIFPPSAFPLFSWIGVLLFLISLIFLILAFYV